MASMNAVTSVHRQSEGISEILYLSNFAERSVRSMLTNVPTVATVYFIRIMGELFSRNDS